MYVWKQWKLVTLLFKAQYSEYFRLSYDDHLNKSDIVQQIELKSIAHDLYRAGTQHIEQQINNYIYYKKTVINNFLFWYFKIYKNSLKTITPISIL